jgi:hypothetical protein
MTYNKRILIAGVLQLVAGILLRETFKNSGVVLAGEILIVTGIITEIVASWNKQNYKWLAVCMIIAAGFLLYVLVK